MRIAKGIKRKIVWLAALLAAALCLSACGKSEEGDYTLYYLNYDRTKLVQKSFASQSEDTDGLIEELIAKISEDPGAQGYAEEVGVLGDDVTIDSYELQSGILSLYFSGAYYDMETGEEALGRGAIVHTMMQVDGVDGVRFFVDSQPLTNANGTEVGLMTDDSFVENPGEQINNIQEADLTLYFANQTGDGLVSESQHVYYSSNISIEKLVMERLLAGPESSNARSAIPTGTHLVSVSVMDGVCFVNLDDNFTVQNYEISEEVVIYSIVNSLSELSTVDTVQISVNGATDRTYRDKLSLSEYYKARPGLVVESGEDVEISSGEEKESVINSTE